MKWLPGRRPIIGGVGFTPRKPIELRGLRAILGAQEFAFARMGQRLGGFIPRLTSAENPWQSTSDEFSAVGSGAGGTWSAGRTPTLDMWTLTFRPLRQDHGGHRAAAPDDTVPRGNYLIRLLIRSVNIELQAAFYALSTNEADQHSITTVVLRPLSDLAGQVVWHAAHVVLPLTDDIHAYRVRFTARRGSHFDVGVLYELVLDEPPLAWHSAFGNPELYGDEWIGHLQDEAAVAAWYRDGAVRGWTQSVAEHRPTYVRDGVRELVHSVLFGGQWFGPVDELGIGTMAGWGLFGFDVEGQVLGILYGPLVGESDFGFELEASIGAIAGLVSEGSFGFELEASISAIAARTAETAFGFELEASISAFSALAGLGSFGFDADAVIGARAALAGLATFGFDVEAAIDSNTLAELAALGTFGFDVEAALAGRGTLAALGTFGVDLQAIIGGIAAMQGELLFGFEGEAAGSARGPLEELLGLHGPIHWWKTQSIAGQNVQDFGSAQLGIRVAGDGSSVILGDVPAYARGPGDVNRYASENASSTAPNGQIILVSDEDHVSFGPADDHVWYTIVHLDLTTGDSLTGLLASLVDSDRKFQIYYDAIQGESGHAFTGYFLRVVNTSGADVDIPLFYPGDGATQAMTYLLGYEWKYNGPGVPQIVQGYALPLDADYIDRSIGNYLYLGGSHSAAGGAGHSLVPVAAGNQVRSWALIEEGTATDKRVIAHHLTGSAMTGAKIQQSHVTVLPGPVGLQQVVDIAATLGHARQREQAIDPVVLSVTTTLHGATGMGSVDIPATDDGDLLVLVGAVGDSRTTINNLGSWTQIYAKSGAGTNDAGAYTWVYAMRSSGGAATTIANVLQSTGHTGGVHQVYRIQAGTWHDTGTITAQGVLAAVDSDNDVMIFDCYTRDTAFGGAPPAAPANRLAPWAAYQTSANGAGSNSAAALSVTRTTRAVNCYRAAGSNLSTARYHTVNGTGSTQHNLHHHMIFAVRSPGYEVVPVARPTSWVDLVRYETIPGVSGQRRIALVAPAIEATDWVRDAWTGRAFNTAGVTNFNTSAVWGVANSLRFSGTNAFLADESNLIDLSTAWTISIAVSSHTLGAGRCLFQMGSGTNVLLCHVDASGHLTIQRNLNAAGNASTTYTVGMSTNTFYGLTVKYDGPGNSLIKVFFQGSLLGTISTAGQAWASVTGIRFGLLNDSSGDFDGDMVIRYAGGHALPDYQCACYSRLNYGAPKT